LIGVVLRQVMAVMSAAPSAAPSWLCHFLSLGPKVHSIHHEIRADLVSIANRVYQMRVTQSRHVEEMMSVFEKDLTQEHISQNLPSMRSVMTDRPSLLRIWGNRLDAAIGLVIVANAVCIGIETDREMWGVEENNAVMAAFEYFFLLCYILELAIHIWLEGFVPYVIHNRWGRFDFVIVLLGLVSTLFSTPVFDQVMIARICRLLKLTRAVRMLRVFRTLWVLVRGIYSTLGLLFWTLVLFAMLFYLFAVMGVELIRSDGELQSDADSELAIIVQDKFGTISKAMLTMLQFTTMDSWTSVAQPLIYARPYLAVYFLVFILISSVAFMNLVTATIVETSIQSSDDDWQTREAFEREQKRHIARELKALIELSDTDKSGTVTKDELRKAFDTDKVFHDHMLLFGEHWDEISETFDMIDVGNDGSLTVTEFLEGMVDINTDKQLYLLMRIWAMLQDWHQRGSVCALSPEGAAGAAELRGASANGSSAAPPMPSGGMHVCEGEDAVALADELLVDSVVEEDRGDMQGDTQGWSPPPNEPPGDPSLQALWDCVDVLQEKIGSLTKRVKDVGGLTADADSAVKRVAAQVDGIEARLCVTNDANIGLVLPSAREPD